MATLNTEIATQGRRLRHSGRRGRRQRRARGLAGDEARRPIARARGEGPTLIEAKTYRTVGHHEGDPVIGTYRTQEEVDAWAKRDPIDMFRKRLVEEFGVADAGELDAIEARDRRGRAGRARVRAQLAGARSGDGRDATSSPSRSTRRRRCAARPPAPTRHDRAGSTRCATASPRRCGANPHILYFGEGTGERGGTFAHTKGLWQEFGADRMVDTPISEQGFTGAAIGASATGARTVADLMFADFMFEAGGPDRAAGGEAPLHEQRPDERADGGARRRRRACAAPARTTAAPIIRCGRMCPGLIVCVPSTPADAKGLMKTALRAADPVIMLETEGAVRQQGRGAGRRALRAVRRRPHRARRHRPHHRRRPGQLVHRALEAAEMLARRGHRRARSSTSAPSCRSTSRRSPRASRKTHRLLVVDEGWAMCGVGAELGAGDERARLRRARRAGRPAAHRRRSSHPFAPALERAMLVDAATHRRRGARRDRRHARRCRAIGGRAGVGSAPADRRRPPRRSRVQPRSRRRSRASRCAADRRRADHHAVRRPHGQRRQDRALGEGGRRASRPGELVAEIETDKAVVEIEAPCTGVLARIEQPAGAVVPMGGRIGDRAAGVTRDRALHHVAGGPAAIDRQHVAVDVARSRARRGTARLARSLPAAPAGRAECAPSAGQSGRGSCRPRRRRAFA